MLKRVESQVERTNAIAKNAESAFKSVKDKENYLDTVIEKLHSQTNNVED